MEDKMNDKDQAAIDHVASVSKHPHAAMIVKWLITGWDVEIKPSGEWRPLSGDIEPSWSGKFEYRLIEPKKWPTQLVERIAAIDIKAAEWIVEHWDDLTNIRYSQGEYCRESKSLYHMFSWDACDEFEWDKISYKLRE